MRRNMSGNLGMYKYLWPGSVYIVYTLHSCGTTLSITVTTCEAEIAFSMLRRIHTYLRNLQTQQRVKHFSVMADMGMWRGCWMCVSTRSYRARFKGSTYSAILYSNIEFANFQF